MSKKDVIVIKRTSRTTIRLDEANELLVKSFVSEEVGGRSIAWGRGRANTQTAPWNRSRQVWNSFSFKEELASTQSLEMIQKLWIKWIFWSGRRSDVVAGESIEEIENEETTQFVPPFKIRKCWNRCLLVLTETEPKEINEERKEETCHSHINRHSKQALEEGVIIVWCFNPCACWNYSLQCLVQAKKSSLLKQPLRMIKGHKQHEDCSFDLSVVYKTIREEQPVW